MSHLIVHRSFVTVLLAETSVWTWAESNVVKSVCICIFIVKSNERELEEIKAWGNGQN